MQISDQTKLAIVKNSSKGADKVELKLDKPIPKEIQGKVIKAKITNIKQDGSVKLTLKNGKTITGKLAEPLPKGTEITFTTNEEGKVKVIKLNISENISKKNNTEQQPKNNNQSNKQTTKQDAQLNTTNKTPTAPVKIQTTDNKPLPANSNMKFDAVVATAKANKNGFQQIILTNKQATKLNIKLPVQLEKGTNLTIKIINHNEARVLNIKTVNRQFTINEPIKNNITDIKFTNNKNLPSGSKVEVTTVSSTPNKEGFFKAVTSDGSKVNIKLPINTQLGTKLNIQILPKNEALIIKEEPPITGKNLLANKPINKGPDQQSMVKQNSEPSVTINKHELPPFKIKVSEDAQIPKSLQNKLSETPNTSSTVISNSKFLQSIKIIAPKNAKIDVISQSIKLLQSNSNKQISMPINTPITGKIEPLIANTKPTQKNTPNAILKLPQGINLDIISKTTLVKGTIMAISFKPNGVAEILRIVEPTPKNGQQGQNQQNPSQKNTPYQTAQKALNMTSGSKFTAIVSSKSDGGIQTLSLPNGQKFSAHSTKPLPLGAEVSVKIMPSGEAEIIKLNLPSANIKAEAMLDFSRRWGELQKAITLLKQTHPTTAKKIEGQIPNPETKAMLPALLQFAEAVSNYNKTKFLGDETLNLLKSLGIDFTADLPQLNSLQQKPDTPDGWRAFFFPFMNGKDADQAGFYWRNQEDDNNDKSTRFVVNLSLSELGPVQIDGLMQDKHMMLKIRLHELPFDNFEEEINKVSQKLLQPLEIQGSIKVEVSQTFPTDPLHDILQDENHSGLVV